MVEQICGAIIYRDEEQKSLPDENNERITAPILRMSIYQLLSKVNLPSW